MKESYNFKKTLLLVAVLLFFSAQLWAQTITPGTNPKVMRYQNATFTVDVENITGSALSDLTLEAAPMYSGSPSAEFIVTSSSITGISIAAGATYPATFNVKAKCGAPQTGATISYTLKDNSDAVIATGNSPGINIDEPEFIFTRAADFVADYVSNTKEYTRVWAIQQTTNNSVNNLRVVNTCNKSNINITKVELVNDILGSVVLDGTMTGVLDVTQAGMYIYNIGSSVLTQIGNADAWFDNGEIIYIRETYKILTCNDAKSTYTYGHGDGTNFCVGTAQSITTASVVNPGYSPDIATINMGSSTYVTFPTSASDVGVMNFALSNNNTDPKSVLYDTKVAVFVSGNSTLSMLNLSPNYVFTRAYFVNASGVEIAGAPALTMTNNTAFGTVAASPYCWVVSFDNFNNPALATTYEALGLSDMTGDGIWNDLAAGSICRIGVEWQFVQPTPAIPGGCTGTGMPTPINNCYRHATLWYNNSCNQYQGFERDCVINGNTQFPSTGARISYIDRVAPRTITITPENIAPLQEVELRIDEVMPETSYYYGWLISQNNYDQYIIVTLPEGFDYDDAQQGVRINTAAPCALADVVRTEVGGRVVLTIHNRLVTPATSNYYCITMFATATITSDALKTIDLQHGWNWKNAPAAGMTKYGCHLNLPVNYKLIVPYQNMTLTAFEAQRMTFGWNTYQMTERITLSNIGSYPNVRRNAAGPYDNIDMTGTIEIESGFSVGSDRWLVDVNYKTGTSDYFSFPNPAQAAIVLLNDLPIIDIPLSNLVVLSTNIGGSNRQRTIRVDLTDYPELASLADGDVVKVILKTQTTEQLPNTYTQLQDFTMQTYLQSGIDPNKNILTKNLFLVNYASSFFEMSSLAAGAVFHANNSETTYWSGGFRSFLQTALSGTEIFTGEFRPNYTINSTTWTYNTLIDITEVQTVERSDGETPSVRTTNLTPGDYTVTHSAGKTTVTVNRELNSERIESELYLVQSRGIFYCTNDINVSRRVNATFFPTSENPTNKVYNATNLNMFGSGKNEYAYALTTASPDVYPAVNHAEWAITLTNQSLWAATDGNLPNSWISVTLPPEVDPTTILLTDGGAITKTYADFISYGSGKYWVQLGDLNITSYKNFTLSCTYTACNSFDVAVSYGMSRAAYPRNPDYGFENGTGTFCGLKPSITLHAHVKAIALRGEVITPTPDGIITPSRYLFCEFHTFKAIFSNVQEGVLVDPVLRVRIAKGVELKHATITALQNTTVPTDLFSYITVVGDDLNTAHERMVEIKLPGVTLQPYDAVGGGNEIEITFELKATCGFTSGSTVDMVFAATGCEEVKESHSSNPIKIDGAELVSTYDIAIGTFAVTGDLDFSNATVAGSSELNLKAVIELISPDQQYDMSHVISDFIALSLPPHLTPTSVAPNPLVFTFVEMEAGQALWYAEMPILAQNETCEVDVMLTPDSDYDEWSCDNVNISIYTGAIIGGECDAVVCTMTEKNCDERATTVPVVKTDVSFKAGSIVATGKYHSATEESVSVEGTLIVPKDTDIDDLLIEFYSNQSDDFVVGASILIDNVKVTGSDTEFDFSGTDIIIPAADMCDLSLVIRKTATQNQFICEDVDYRLYNIGFEMTTDEYEDCAETNITVGDANAITGYTYEWTPTTYIVGSATGTPITVKYPVSMTGEQTLNVTVHRGGCSVSTTVTVEVTPLAVANDIITKNDTICKGGNSTLTVSSAIPSAVFNWYTSQTSTSAVHTGATLPLTALTADTTFYVGVSGTGYCENATGTRKKVQVIIGSCLLIDCKTAAKTVIQDTCGVAYYTHVDDSWDIEPLSGLSFDSVKYLVNGVIKSHGATATLAGVQFAAKTTSAVEAIAYFDIITDTCRFNVTVDTIPLAEMGDITAANVTICLGETASLTAGSTIPNPMFRWYASQTSTTVLGTGATLAKSGVTGDTTFYVGVSGTDYCENDINQRKAVAVFVTPRAVAADINVVYVANDTICSGETVTITVTSAIPSPVYRWYTSQTSSTAVYTGTSQTLTALTSDTTFYIGVSGTGYCENDTNKRQPATVTVTPRAVAADIITKNDSICSGANATLTVSSAIPGAVFNWYSSQTSTTPLSTGTVKTFTAMTSDTTFYVGVSGTGYCENDTNTRKQVKVVVKPFALPDVITLNDTTICSGTTVTLSPQTTAINPTFKWYISQTEPTPFYTGSPLTTGILTEDTTLYVFVAVSGDNFCENSINNRKDVTVHVKVCDLIDCDPSPRTVTEDACGTGQYTHSGADWNIQPIGSIVFDSVKYVVNSITRSSGITATLSGVMFTTGMPQLVECIAYSGTITDTCRFSVMVEPIPVAVVNELTVLNDLICAGKTATLTATSALSNPVIRWYESQTSATVLHTGATYITDPLSTDTAFYVSVSNAGHCEIAAGDRALATVTVVSTPAAPVITVNPLPAFQGSLVDLSAAVNILPDLTYTYYANADGTGILPGSTVTYNPPKNDYYVSASNGVCTSDLSQIILQDPCPATISDAQGNPYKVTSLGGFCWTENLRATQYADNTPIGFANVYTCPTCPPQLDTIFGLLYDWYSATGGDICPVGWHVPTQAEWSALNAFPAQTLKSTHYWLNPPGVGTDDYGWDARPAGWFNSALNRYQDLYGYAGWWASDDNAGTTASAFYISYYCSKVEKEIKTKADGLSVRCVMD